MRFKGLDLNLITAFVALVETSSVTRAAHRLCLSQPAMSAALKRLRDYFHDDILVIDGKRMYPTPYADSLLPQLRASLEHLEQVIQTSAKFDPATSERTFRIAASDYITTVLVAPMVSRFADVAPHIKVEITLPGEDVRERMDRGDIDLLLTPDYFTVDNHPTDLLFEERHVVAGWSGNPLFPGPIDEAAFLAQGHVSVAFGHQRTLSFGDRTLQSLGKNRRIDIVSPSFIAVPSLLRNTRKLAVMHERLARSLAAGHELSFTALPFPFPMMREMVQYHRARESDAGLDWLRRRLLSTAA